MKPAATSSAHSPIGAAVQNFFSFIEIKTKIASYIPFALGLAYAFYIARSMNLRGTLVFAVAMVLFDMSVTAINMYLDHKEAGIPGHYSRAVSLAIIYSFVLISFALGMLLVYWHGLQILIAGAICFAVGIGYTYGPAPISKSPFSEPVSGVTQGFVLPFLVVAINTRPLAAFTLQDGGVSVWLDVLGLAKLFLVCYPLVAGIANIMLANNTCDIEQDRHTRYTMPRHIGVKNAVRLFGVIAYSMYAAVAVACFLRVLPWTCLLVMPTAFIAHKNVKLFRAKQLKSETFVLSIQNFVILNVPLAMLIVAGALL